MVYLIFDVKGIDCWCSKVYTSKKKAIEDCKREWNALTQHDKNQRSSFRVEAMENADDYEGDIIYECVVF